MMKQKLPCLLVLLFSICGNSLLSAQEIGANFNHDPEIIDLNYLKKTPVEWIRTTPYIKNNGVVLATYGYFSQSAPQKVGPNTPTWFVNPIFPGKSLLPHADGSVMENPLWYQDFVDAAKMGKESKERNQLKISKQ